jgi:hypothetical protein
MSHNCGHSKLFINEREFRMLSPCLWCRNEKLDRIVRRVSALDLGPKGYCSGSLFKLREDAMSALAK